MFKLPDSNLDVAQISKVFRRGRKKRMKRKEEENEKKKAISVVLMLSREQKIWPQNITDLKTFSPKGKI